MDVMGKPADAYPITPDGRYFVVRGRLWRRSNPALDPNVREQLVKDLMEARRGVRTGQSHNDLPVVIAARRAIDAAKVALGERGDPWWRDGAPDFNRRLVRNTPYADWFAALG